PDDAGIVEEAVDAAPVLGHGLDHAVDEGLIRDAPDMGRQRRAALLGEALQTVAVQADGTDAAAQADDHPRDLAADALRGPGYQYGPAFEAEGSHQATSPLRFQRLTGARLPRPRRGAPTRLTLARRCRAGVRKGRKNQDAVAARGGRCRRITTRPLEETMKR